MSDSRGTWGTPPQWRPAEVGAAGAAPTGPWLQFLSLFQQLVVATFANKPVGLTSPLSTISETANYTILVADDGAAFDNYGAAGEVDFTLPAASAGLHFSFAVFAAQTLKVIADASDKIAIGTSNSAAGGNIASNSVYSTVMIYSRGSGQWVALAAEGTWVVT